MPHRAHTYPYAYLNIGTLQLPANKFGASNIIVPSPHLTHGACRGLWKVLHLMPGIKSKRLCLSSVLAPEQSSEICQKTHAANKLRRQATHSLAVWRQLIGIHPDCAQGSKLHLEKHALLT